MTTGVCGAVESSSPTMRYHVSWPSRRIRPSWAVISLSFLGAGNGAVERVVARRQAGASVVDERRPLDAADLCGVATARVEAAPARRVDRARHLALEHDALAGRGSVVVGLDPRNGGEQRVGVRV